MPAPSNLILEPVTLEDVTALTEVWFAAFAHDPAINRLWPDTPLVRAWWDGANRSDIVAKPFQRFVKVVDPNIADARGGARIAAWAKWDTSMPGQRGRRYPPWCEDMPGKVCDAFIESEERERGRLMGEENHYYLDTLVTHPDYQRRGAGSMLLKWGCELADENGVGAYVDSSKAGRGLYERFGFLDMSESDAGEVASMVRRRRSQDSCCLPAKC
ncbi:Putative GNAT domain, acyl-CoA N-acyltransferase [Colletotrichum destructivum]|uniref:GNAT domain, acyl-CoA N-acyltransferase n=1 Tax=Colletotrichum destructivum TaxID=34406 RepID=A0AAX4IDU1_9PEZI|nr:Putative GNAT domain, acyl-CoA N-acyltransferase [Colletotrichum destructivum]